MGKLINGKWLNDAKLASFEKQQYQAANGQFIRRSAQFRHWVTHDGSSGITGDSGFKAEAGRYHLYAAINCPWAQKYLKSLGLTLPSRRETLHKSI